MNPIDEALETRFRSVITDAMDTPCDRHELYIACTSRIADAACDVAATLIHVGWYHPEFSMGGLNKVRPGRPPHHEDDPRWEPVFVCNT